MMPKSMPLRRVAKGDALCRGVTDQHNVRMTIIRARFFDLKYTK
jgi:hypothetical protein